MEHRIAQALNRFESVCEGWQDAPGKMEKLAPYAYVWHPEQIRVNLGKPIGLTLQAVTHGNEVGGIEVLLETLRILANSLIQPPFSIGFVLGNPAGAKANRRFVERDLNRSFGQTADNFEEERRARLLEPILENSALFVDFHQTIEPSAQAFFIFPYTPSALSFACGLHGQIPIVTHWGPSFSKDGMCTDEFVNHRGGNGLTIELGQKGFDSYHTGLGLQVVLGAVQYAMGRSPGTRSSPPQKNEELYTWRAVVPFEEGMRLNEGLVNFQAVAQGDVVGFHGSQILRAPTQGWILFPKYLRDPKAPAPKELYRIIKRIAYDELGQDGVINR